MTQHEGRDSVPDLLAHAVVVADEEPALDEPFEDSPVDQWAFPELAVIAGPTRGKDAIDDWALEERTFSGDLVDEPGVGLEPVEPPTTIRPSAVTLRPAAQKPRRRPAAGLLMMGVAAVAAIGLFAWSQGNAAAPAQAAAAGEAVPAPEVERAPVEAPKPTRTLRLRSDQPGVTVTIAGETWGPLPVSLTHLKSGTYQAQFDAPGFHGEEREITVAEGVRDLDVALKPKPVPVILEVEPKDAYIMISAPGRYDGARYPGPWPRVVELDPGTYRVVAFGKGLSMVQRDIEVAPAAKASAVRFELRQAEFYEL